MGAALRFFERPLRTMYFSGPYHLGCWQGNAETDICSQLTGVDAAFWYQHPHECEDLLDRKFRSVAITVYMAVLLAGCYMSLNHCMIHYTIVRPLQRALRSKRLGLDDAAEEG